MSALVKEQMNLLLDDDEARWQAVLGRDARANGQFVFGVSSTGIYCRPTCPARRPLRKHVSFFHSPDQAEQAGFRACRRCRPRAATMVDPQVHLARTVCRLLEESDGEPVTLAALSQKLGVSSFHLQRTFKSIMGTTPRRYAETCRVQRFKQNVQQGEAITSAIYDAGYGSSSRLYEHASAQLGMTPATYGKGGRGAVINYATAPTPLGKLLVAATDKGVCSVMLGDSEESLLEELMREFPAAAIRQDDNALHSSLAAVVAHLESQSPHVDLPLDIQATAFQRRVWEQLRAIPYGQTSSYGEVAKAIGQEKAVRAVARACATNPVALVIPCHRVIREDKSLGGYRWGLERKQKLLEAEAKQAR
jgi:AraC family transcriptional regulator, regulatory protein of adaptative response / methylated-DNA-[protein]-cysteine methyltransferase